MQGKRPAGWRSFGFCAAVVIFAFSGGCDSRQPVAGDKPVARKQAKDIEEPQYIGSDNCGGCHQAEYREWQTSHHRGAMQKATPETVLGDFDSVSFEHAGARARFRRNSDEFRVTTDGPDGEAREYKVLYTLGIFPLQQYLVHTGEGHIQVLPFAWDTRPEADGGQRWFHIYPEEKIGHGDILHWTGRYQNWNAMCADCHTVNFRKNYNEMTDNYDSHFSESTVGCEGCHGPGTVHRDWAQSGKFGTDRSGSGLVVDFNEREGVSWTWNTETGRPERSAPRKTQTEIDTCGGCHARRGLLVEKQRYGVPFGDQYQLSLIQPPLYRVDGQIDDEVYVYGSFLQSKMFAAGVTCSDCHNPHSGELRAPGAGVCLQCHEATRYQSQDHHHHQPESSGADCLECHMPDKTYMVVDPRRDHSFRIPRPDLSVAYGVPNACNQCHQDQTAEWARKSIVELFGEEKKGFQQFAPALHAAWQGMPEAPKLLADLIANTVQPDIARASALDALAPYLSRETLGSVERGLNDDSALVRAAAVAALANTPAELRLNLLPFMLHDPVRSVRTEVAWVLADIPDSQLPKGLAGLRKRAEEEYLKAQHLGTDRPESWLNLGQFNLRKGDIKRAEADFGQALNRVPWFPAAVISLAEIYRLTDRDPKAKSMLAEAIEHYPENADLHYSLGLVLIRLGEKAQALEQLGKAAELGTDQPHYQYVYGVALQDQRRGYEAEAVWLKALENYPHDREILSALVAFYRDTGNREKMREYLQRLSDLSR